MLRLSEKTYSLWGYLIANNDEFTNPLYDSSSQSDVLRPTIAPQFIKFWSGLYCRFENGKIYCVCGIHCVTKRELYCLFSEYRVAHLVADLGWVDFDFSVQPYCTLFQPLLPNLPKQNWADNGTLKIQVIPT